MFATHVVMKYQTFFIKKTFLLCYVCRYGVVLRELSMVSEARNMFVRSLHLTPLLWASWQELAKLCEDRDMVCTLLQYQEGAFV